MKLRACTCDVGLRPLFLFAEETAATGDNSASFHRRA